jgi:hypothetical protein
MAEAEMVIRSRSPEPQRALPHAEISARYCKLPRAQSDQQRTAGQTCLNDLAFRAEKLPGSTFLTLT